MSHPAAHPLLGPLMRHTPPVATGARLVQPMGDLRAELIADAHLLPRYASGRTYSARGYTGHTRAQIKTLLRAEPNLRAVTIAQRLARARNVINALLQKMVAQGELTATGHHRTRAYRLAVV